MKVKIINIEFLHVDLKAKREKAGLSQTDLAVLVGKTREHINRLEKEKKVCPERLWYKIKEILK